MARKLGVYWHLVGGVGYRFSYGDVDFCGWRQVAQSGGKQHPAQC